MNINLHIKELVLNGVNMAPNQQLALENAITQELTQILSAQGISPNQAQGASSAPISTNNVEFNNTDPKQTGRQLAQAIYKGISHV